MKLISPVIAPSTFLTTSPTHPLDPKSLATRPEVVLPLLHRRYTHSQVFIPTTSLENTTVHIQVNNTTLRLVATYKRPTNLFLPADLSTLLDTPLNTIVAGQQLLN